MRFLALGVLAMTAAAAPAYAIHVEQAQPGFHDPDLAIAALSRIETDQSSADAFSPTAYFVGGKMHGSARKPFPAGYGRSGYEFADELTAAPPAEPGATPAPATAPASTPQPKK